MNKVNIKDLPIGERPREKMIVQGASALSNAELLAILIGSGNSEETAVGLMQRVLHDCDNSLNALGKMTIDDLIAKYRGIGEAKAITLLAACELGSRRRREEVLKQQLITNSKDAFEYFSDMCDLPLEECRVLMLRQNHSIITSALISKGGLTGTMVDVREVMRQTLLNRAAAIVLCHNHPSGNLRPSRDDDMLTKNIAEACRILKVRFVDHIIVANLGYYSYKEEGKV